MTSATGWVRTHPAYRAVVKRWPDAAMLACSGGVDSSALLVLGGIGVQRGDIEPFVVVHVDHRTRPESGSEGAIVEALAARYDLPTIQVSVSDVDLADGGLSPEERLRTLRYEAIARVASEQGIEHVVTAHTRDDQVETVLMRLLTGAGGLATAGMSSIATMMTNQGTIQIHRPLLDVSRTALVDVLERVGVDPIVDPSNTDSAYRRNEVRHELVPRLKRAFPGFESALLRSVVLAARDADALDGMTSTIVESIATETGEVISIDRHALRELHPALASRVIRWAAGALMPDNQRELSFERVEAVRTAILGRSGAVFELPYSVVARVERAAIVFERRNVDRVN